MKLTLLEILIPSLLCSLPCKIYPLAPLVARAMLIAKMFDPLVFSVVSLSIAVAFLILAYYNRSLLSTAQGLAKFCWGCFLKPHTGDRTRDQQDALESFYKAQASIYDATRVRLLRGREDMLGLAAAQIRQRVVAELCPRRPVWVDVSTSKDPLWSRPFC